MNYLQQKFKEMRSYVNSSKRQAKQQLAGGLTVTLHQDMKLELYRTHHTPPSDVEVQTCARDFGHTDFSILKEGSVVFIVPDKVPDELLEAA